MKNIINAIVNKNSILKKLKTGELYKISANNPQSITSYEVNINKKLIAIIIVSHQGKKRILANIDKLKIILSVIL